MLLFFTDTSTWSSACIPAKRSYLQGPEKDHGPSFPATSRDSTPVLQTPDASQRKSPARTMPVRGRSVDIVNHPRIKGMECLWTAHPNQ